MSGASKMKIDYIQQGDSGDLLATLPDGAIDITVTSPPYDKLRHYQGYEVNYGKVISELHRITKEGGVVVWIVSDGVENGSETGTSFRQALHFIEAGFRLHDTMIWKKDTFAFPETTRYQQTFDYMFIFSKGRPKSIKLIHDRRNKYGGQKVKSPSYRQPDGRTLGKKNIEVKEWGCRFNVWEVPTEKNNKSGHPAVYPVRLAQDHILSWSEEGDIVLDPFIGSGTTAIAALRTKRHYIGFDISREYCQATEKRIEGERKKEEQILLHI